MDTMLILRGIKGHFAGRDWPHGALDEAPAVEYARRLGYVGKVLDVDGGNGPGNKQTAMAVQCIRTDPTVTALYGFSGGGYNARHIWDALAPALRARLTRIIVLGAPGVTAQDFPGCAVVHIAVDPPKSVGGHMAGPRVLLEKLGPEPRPQVAVPPPVPQPTSLFQQLLKLLRR